MIIDFITFLLSIISHENIDIYSTEYDDYDVVYRFAEYVINDSSK